MTKLLLIFILGMFANHTITGQESDVSEFDLYGCWSWERFHKGDYAEGQTYLHCDSEKLKNIWPRTIFSLNAFNICEFYYIGADDAIIGVKGEWTFDSKKGIVEILYPKDYFKEFWDKVKETEEYSEIQVPKRTVYKRFRVIEVKKNRLRIKELEKKLAKK